MLSNRLTIVNDKVNLFLLDSDAATQIPSEQLPACVEHEPKCAASASS